ncbi:hypothetical protein RB195_012795 [Necator americanus]|uniref:Uncharacterized protein n=1 Tax=Necator americanus TaxID=51031 RepID=A0ABR1DSK8_NECAM
MSSSYSPSDDKFRKLEVTNQNLCLRTEVETLWTFPEVIKYNSDFCGGFENEVREENDRACVDTIAGEMNDDLFADEEDRRKVMAMNKKDREQEILKRMEEQEKRLLRKQIEEKLAAVQNAGFGFGDMKEREERSGVKRRII